MKKRAATNTGDNSFGVASVILGILSIVFLSFNGLILGIIALVFATKQQNRNPNKWGRVGKILSIIGIILSVLILILLVVGLVTNPGLFSGLEQ